MTAHYFAAIAEDFGCITHYRILVHTNRNTTLRHTEVLKRAQSEIDVNIVCVRKIESIRGGSGYLEYRAIVW